MAGNKKKKSGISNNLNNPFGALKGFAVSAGDPEPVAAPGPPSPIAEEVDFCAQMTRFGVQRLHVEGPVPDQDSTGQSLDIESEKTASDQETFLTAMKGLNVTFKDDYTTEELSPPPTLRRMKQLVRGTLVPEAILDLHGLARQDVEARLLSFIANARHHGRQVLLVITGKGLHSPEGEGILRAEVEAFLQQRKSEQIVEWARAPRQYGGDGAIVLFLRRQQD